MRILSILFLFCCISSIFADSGARLIISRAILNEELIVGKDTVVNVEIYNVGDEYDILNLFAFFFLIIEYIDLPMTSNTQKWELLRNLTQLLVFQLEHLGQNLHRK